MDWQTTLKHVAQGVAWIKYSHTRSFDTQTANSAQATGFLVDIEKGYILTNRHVINGPFSGIAILFGQQEVIVHPRYCDPVHDFGILQYDPESVRFPGIARIDLRPDLVKVGEDIRILGNDASQDLSIHSGVISRVDRNAPEYNQFLYNDFNTNYLQAATGTTGGSSGSPVVNVHGQAIAIVAGIHYTALTNYLLPLDRPLRALQCLQNGNPITRGTIQCQWKIESYDKCRHLGLPHNWESIFREFPGLNGLLVVERVLKEGPSDEKLYIGDILIKINGNFVVHFKDLDEILDSRVGASIVLLIHRSDQDIEVEVEVEDLYRITPDRFVSIAGANFQTLSYQRARSFELPCKGVSLCDKDGSFTSLENGSVILKIQGKPTPCLDTFIEVMKAIPDHETVVISYICLGDVFNIQTTSVRIDRYWFRDMTLSIRNDATGLWDTEILAQAIPKVHPVLQKATFQQLSKNLPPVVKATYFVKISCNILTQMDGQPPLTREGMGVIIDNEMGLVIISRLTVPHGQCDIFVTIADSITVDGEYVFAHPTHNYTFIKYNPQLVDAEVQQVKLSPDIVEQGASLHFVGFENLTNHGPLWMQTTITGTSTVNITANPHNPLIRAINSQIVRVDTTLSKDCGSGILVDDNGFVQALWLVALNAYKTNYFFESYGLIPRTLLPVIRKIQNGKIRDLRILSAEFEAITKSQARHWKVSEDWIGKFELAESLEHRLFKVKQLNFDDSDSDHLCEGDILLTINDNLVTSVSKLDIVNDEEEIETRIVRDGKEMMLKVRTTLADEFETKRTIVFCGAILQAPHYAVRLQVGKTPSEVYVSGLTPGAPAIQYGLSRTDFITHIGNTPTPNLDAVLQAEKEIPQDSPFTLTVMRLDSTTDKISMRENRYYFPTKEFIRDSPRWRQT